jgi:hypothetical protein
LQHVVQRRVLRYFRRHGLLDEADAHGMLSWRGSGGFSIDASVRIEGEDRAGVAQARTGRPHRARARSDSAPREDRSLHTAPARPSPPLSRRPCPERQTPCRRHVHRQARSRDTLPPSIRSSAAATTSSEISSGIYRRTSTRK